jgi:hypothetical protein
MKLQELSAPTPSKQIAKVFESYFGNRISFDQLTRGQTQAMLGKVRGILGEHRKTSARHSSEQDPRYLQLVMMEQALSSRLQENVIPPAPGTAPATPQSSPSNASNPILDQLRKTWKDLGTPRYSPVPQSASPGVDDETNYPAQSLGVKGDNSPGQPYIVPGSQDWNNMSHAEQMAMAARAIINNETHKFTGGRRSDVKDIDQVLHPRFSEDSGEGDPASSPINQRSKIANAVFDKQNAAAQAQLSSGFNRDAGVAENDPNYIYSRGGYAQSPYSPEEPKPAEDTRPTSGRKSIYPGSFQDILDRMQNNNRSTNVSSMLKQGQARRNFNRRAK